MQGERAYHMFMKLTDIPFIWSYRIATLGMLSLFVSLSLVNLSSG